MMMKRAAAKIIAGVFFVAVSAVGIAAYNADSAAFGLKVQAEAAAASGGTCNRAGAAEEEGPDELNLRNAEAGQSAVEGLPNGNEEKTEPEKEAEAAAAAGNIPAAAAPVASAEADLTAQAAGQNAEAVIQAEAEINNAADKAADEKAAAEQAERERLEAERIAAEQAERERLEAERIAAEQAERERLEAEWAEKEALEASEIISSVVIIEEPKPVIKKIVHWNCVCGFDTTDKNAFQQHALEGVRRGEQHNYHNWIEEVEVYE